MENTEPGIVANEKGQETQKRGLEIEELVATNFLFLQQHYYMY